MKFRAVAGGERLEELWCTPDQGVQSPVHGGHGAIVELSDEGESCAAFNECEDAVRGAMTHNDLDFPMAEFGPIIDAFGAFGDVAIPSESSTGI